MVVPAQLRKTWALHRTNQCCIAASVPGAGAGSLGGSAQGTKTHPVANVRLVRRKAWRAKLMGRRLWRGDACNKAPDWSIERSVGKPHTLQLQPVRIALGADERACLVFARNKLVAVLVQLSEQHGEFVGTWFLEAVFGSRLDNGSRPTFHDLAEAQDWIERRLAIRDKVLDRAASGSRAAGGPRACLMKPGQNPSTPCTW